MSTYKLFLLFTAVLASNVQAAPLVQESGLGDSDSGAPLSGSNPTDLGGLSGGGAKDEVATATFPDYFPTGALELTPG
ncbi:hypothetical protein RUND412_007297, partial [Rhizina undulata]